MEDIEKKVAEKPAKEAKAPATAKKEKVEKPATAKPAVEKAEKPAPVTKLAPKAKAVAARSGKQLKITLVRSIIGASLKQQRTVEALGLRKIRSSRVHNDTVQLQGMLTVVKHLVTIENV